MPTNPYIVEMVGIQGPGLRWFVLATIIAIPLIASFGIVVLSYEPRILALLPFAFMGLGLIIYDNTNADINLNKNQNWFSSQLTTAWPSELNAQKTLTEPKTPKGARSGNDTTKVPRTNLPDCTITRLSSHEPSDIVQEFTLQCDGNYVKPATNRIEH